MAQSAHDTVQFKVPSYLKRQLAVDAAKQGVPIRVLVLQALVTAGYKISNDELKDKRKQ